MADFHELKGRARRGALTPAEVVRLLIRGLITEDQADKLNQLITEFERHQQLVAAAAPSVTAMPPFPLRTIEIVAEEIRSNRLNDGEAVDTAWAYAVGLREACGRWPRDERKVTDGFDPFALRVLRFVYNRRFDGLGVAEGVRILSQFSYADLRRLAEQGAHEKRLRVLNGNFDHGVLKPADVGDASKKGLGIPVTVLGGQVVTGLLVQHYNRRAYTVSSFDELEAALTSPAGQGGLDLAAVQKAKEGGKLLQVLSPEVWEQSREERRLQDLLGPEYRYLNSDTGPERADFAVLVDRHRMVLEDGSRDPRPILRIIAERISGDGVTVTEDDLWAYFGGRPDPDVGDPERAQSVFFSEKLAAHFAGRLELPVEVVRRFFTRHHNLAEEIERRQSWAKKRWRGLFGVGSEEQKTPFFFDLMTNTILVGLAGLAAGVALGLLRGLQPYSVISSGVVGAVGLYLLMAVVRRVVRVGVVLTMIISSAIILLAIAGCQEASARNASESGRAIQGYLRREMGIAITPTPAAEELLSQSQPSPWEKLVVPFTGVYALVQGNSLLRFAVVFGGTMLVVISGFALVGLLIYGFRRRHHW